MAGNREGDLALAWFDAPAGLITDTSYSIHATLDTSGGSGAPTTIVPGVDDVSGRALAGGVDGHGEAIIVWSELGADSSDGIFAAVGIPR